MFEKHPFLGRTCTVYEIQQMKKANDQTSSTTFWLLSAIVIFCFSIVGDLKANQSSDQASDKSEEAKPYDGVKWRCIGPFRGGRSVCASGVIGDSQTYFMGTTGGGVWKTEDAGQHWKNVSDGFFKTGSVGAVAVSESNPNIVYVGMGEHAPRGVMTSHGDGVYLSLIHI